MVVRYSHFLFDSKPWATARAIPPPANFVGIPLRAITYLQEQSELDVVSFGVNGHSMGGRLTVLTSIDPRVEDGTPSVGGIVGTPGSSRHVREGRELYELQ